MSRAVYAAALPFGAAHLLQAAAGITALVLLGSLGTEALSAAAAPTALLALACALFAPLGTGVMAAVARAQARHDPARVRVLIGQGVHLALTCGIVAGAAGVLSAPLLLHVMNVPSSVAGTSLAYAQILAVALPGLYVFSIYTAALEALGRTAAAIGMLAASTAIYGVAMFWLHLGALSVPVALLGSTLLVTIGSAALLYARIPVFRLDSARDALFPPVREMSAFVRFDVPAGAQLIAVACADVALTAIANEFGTRGGSAYLIVATTLALLAVPGTAIAAAASIVPGSQRSALPAYGLIAACSCIAVYVFTPPVLRAIVADPHTFAAARTGIFIVAWSAIATGVGSIAGAQAAAGEEGAWPAAIAIGGAWLVLVPFARLFTLRWGLDGLWYAYAMGFAGVTIVQAAAAPFLLRRARDHARARNRSIFS